MIAVQRLWMTSEIPAIADLIDRKITAERASRPDALGIFATKMLETDDPDAEFAYWAREYVGKPGRDTRRACIARLMAAFGITDRPQFKKWLRAKGIVLSND